MRDGLCRSTERHSAGDMALCAGAGKRRARIQLAAQRQPINREPRAASTQETAARPRNDVGNRLRQFGWSTNSMARVRTRGSRRSASRRPIHAISRCAGPSDHRWDRAEDRSTARRRIQGAEGEGEREPLKGPKRKSPGRCRGFDVWSCDWLSTSRRPGRSS